MISSKTKNAVPTVTAAAGNLNRQQAGLPERGRDTKRDRAKERIDYVFLLPFALGGLARREYDDAEYDQASTEYVLRHLHFSEEKHGKDGGKNRRDIDDRRRAGDTDPLHANIAQRLSDRRGENTGDDKVTDGGSQQGRKRHEEKYQYPKDRRARSKRNQRAGESRWSAPSRAERMYGRGKNTARFGKKNIRPCASLTTKRAASLRPSYGDFTPQLKASVTPLPRPLPCWLPAWA